MSFSLKRQKSKEIIAFLIFYKNIFNSTFKHFLLHRFSNHTSIFKRKEIIYYLETLRKNKNSQEVNFIGSGRSALKTINNLCKDDIVIGGNLTCLLPLYHHLYFTEWCGAKHKEILPTLKDIYNKRSKYIGLKITKNLSSKYNSIPFNRKYSLSQKYLYEASMPIISEQQLNSFINISLDVNNEFICQSSSSTITAIFLAFLSGFKKINLYGVDFGGGYFWDMKEFKNQKNIMKLPNRPIRGYKYGPVNLYPKPNSNFKHATETALVPVSKIIECLSIYFDQYEFKIENKSTI